MEENRIDKINNILEQKRNKVKKELETLNGKELHELFMFFYKLNYRENNMITQDRLSEFLEAFERNPFKIQESKEFKKELIENLLTYSNDQMSLLTAAILIKNEYTLDEIVNNYYSNVDVFGQGYYF